MLYVVSIGVIWLIVCALWPYWNQFWLNSDLKEVALYGTKHSISDTRKFLTKKAKERGYAIDPEELHIEKDENNTVSIRWTYLDEINYFGFTLKELEFTLDVIQRETKTTF